MLGLVGRYQHVVVARFAGHQNGPASGIARDAPRHSGSRRIYVVVTARRGPRPVAGLRRWFGLVSFDGGRGEEPDIHGAHTQSRTVQGVLLPPDLFTHSRSILWWV